MQKGSEPSEFLFAGSGPSGPGPPKRERTCRCRHPFIPKPPFKPEGASDAKIHH